jgi:hypothetical protein
VPDTALGLLIVDGTLREVLKPSFAAFWKFQRTLKVEIVDLRLQTMEVAGQGVLTRDKVGLQGSRRSVSIRARWCSTARTCSCLRAVRRWPMRRCSMPPIRSWV